MSLPGPSIQMQALQAKQSQ